jgi:hypothetical protein
MGARAIAHAPTAANSIPNAMSSTIPVRTIRFSIAVPPEYAAWYVHVLF